MIQQQHNALLQITFLLMSKLHKNTEMLYFFPSFFHACLDVLHHSGKSSSVIPFKHYIFCLASDNLSWSSPEKINLAVKCRPLNDLFISVWIDELLASLRVTKTKRLSFKNNSSPKNTL